jgi:hypothetical protein
MLTHYQAMVFFLGFFSGGSCLAFLHYLLYPKQISSPTTAAPAKDDLP